MLYGSTWVACATLAGGFRMSFQISFSDVGLGQLKKIVLTNPTLGKLLKTLRNCLNIQNIHPDTHTTRLLKQLWYVNMIVKYVVRLLDWTNGPRFTYQNAPSVSTKRLAAHCLHRSTDGHSWHHCATHLPEKNLETTANACWHANRAPIGSHCRHEGFAFRAKMPRHYRVCTTDFVWGHDQGQKHK